MSAVLNLNTWTNSSGRQSRLPAGTGLTCNTRNPRQVSSFFLEMINHVRCFTQHAIIMDAVQHQAIGIKQPLCILLFGRYFTLIYSIIKVTDQIRGASLEFCGFHSIQGNTEPSHFTLKFKQHPLENRMATWIFTCCLRTIARLSLLLCPLVT